MMLSEKDLVHLMQLLQNYSTKWNPIGLSLGFIQSELKTISGMLALLTGAPVSYLQELLSRWVQWPTADHPSHPTVGALCTALRSSLVGLGSLAQTIENELKERERTSGKQCLLYLSLWDHCPKLVPPVTTQMQSRPECDTPVCTLSQLLDSTDGRGWKIGGMVYEWLAGLVSRVCLCGLYG